MTDTPIIVPIHLDALVMNTGVAARDGAMRWWQFNYQALNSFQSPEPGAFEHQVGGAPAQGVYLNWSLPRALRSGLQTGDSHAIDYPLVPNRWMVIRMQGTTAQRSATAWVIESDCPLTSGVKQQLPQIDVAQMSMYLVDPAIVKTWLASSDTLRNTTVLDPNSTDPLIANIGVRFPLATPWIERSTDNTFLTAVAPGNPSFSIYYPQNVGVFSMYDDLEGIDTDTLSYQVVGWYSNPADDIMASWKEDTTSQTPYADLLKHLNWKIAEDTAIQADQSLYQGLALSIDWDRAGNPPLQDPLQTIRDSGKLNASIGNTSIDAFSAMIGTQLVQTGHPIQTLNLLQAFQYDLLPLVNEVNGDALLKERIRQAWFGSESGGHWWTIVAASSDGSAATELDASEAAWLSQLNKDQSGLNTELETLYGMQWQFNAAWWKLGQNPDGFFPRIDDAPTNAELETYLDPANSTGITTQLLARFETVNGYLGKVPQPVIDGGATTQDAFQNGIVAFAKQKQLSEGKTLKAVTAARYWKPNNPAILLAGVEPAPDADPEEELTVRIATELTAGITIDETAITAATVGAALPLITHSDGLPFDVNSFMTELFFVDPASANTIATATSQPLATVQAALAAHDPSTYINALPLFGLEPWAQPWNPMYVEWKVNYGHIPYSQGAQRNWTFDGSEYVLTLNGTTPTTQTREIGGISLLSPHTQFVFKKRLDEFLGKYPNADLTQLEDWIAQIDDWAFLAQDLTGLNDLLAQRDGRAFRRPAPSDVLGSANQLVPVADLAGFPSDQPAGQTVLPNAFEGHVTTTPYLPNGPDIPFYGTRQGQFYFEEISVYDKFGRLLWVIEKDGASGLFDAKNFPLAIDPALVANTSVFPQIASVAQMPPRLLQPGRLDFKLADGKDDTKFLGTDASVNPIAGWVLPNHLDNAINVYAPDGTSLGEYRLFAQTDGSKIGQWTAPAHGAITALDDLRTIAPHVYEMLSDPALSNPDNFTAFLQVIDEALWTIDPLGNRSDQNLSVLIGRPLALVRARLQFQTQGPAIQETGWSSTLNPPAPDFINFDFGIRLGDQATRHDGVIGYFLDKNYGHFNSVTEPQGTAAQNYINQIGPIGDTKTGNFINLKFSPSSSQFVTILTDPRAAMHAVTGLLPIKQAEIPAGFVETALSNIEVGFNLGPILTRKVPTPTQGGVVPANTMSVTYPSPIEQGGIWTWWEKNNAASSNDGFDVQNTITNAHLDAENPSLREGVLQLAIDLIKKS